MPPNLLGVLRSPNPDLIPPQMRIGGGKAVLNLPAGPGLQLERSRLVPPLAGLGRRVPELPEPATNPRQRLYQLLLLLLRKPRKQSAAEGVGQGQHYVKDVSATVTD